MNKTDLIKTVSAQTGLNARQSAEVIEAFIDTIVRSVDRGETVTITGFGVFEKRLRAPRVARNPRTRTSIAVEERFIPMFRPGRRFKAVVAGKGRLAPHGRTVQRGTHVKSALPSQEVS